MDKLCLKTIVVGLFLGLAFTAPVEAQPTTYFVDDNAAAGGNGMGWDAPDAPFRFLQDALMVAGDGDLIKVAQGTYHPDDKEGAIDSRDRMLSFVLKGGLLGFVVKGGYAGLGTPDPDLRDPALFVLTILSGDLNEDDVGGFGDVTRNENSLSVVNGGTGTDQATELDGFTIRDGHGGTNVGGAGMFVPPGSSPTIRNCTFTLNWISPAAGPAGGGLLLEASSSSLVEDCLFIDNEGNEGAGMTVRTNSNAEINRCRFENNTATNSGGGGLLIKAAATAKLTDCDFINNKVPQRGGSPLGGGGILLCVQSHASLRGCTLSGNFATDVRGGGIYCDTSSLLTVVDCDFIMNERAEWDIGRKC